MYLSGKLFLIRRVVAATAVCLLICSTGFGAEQPDQESICQMAAPDEFLSPVKPEDVGMDANDVNLFLEKVKSVGRFTDALIIRNGKILAFTGHPARNAHWASAMKIWLSTLTTLMVQNNVIDSFDDKIHYPGLLGKDQDITWSELMLMTSGYGNEELPGERFAYNDRAISLFIAALKWKLGINLTQALKNYLPELGLESETIIEENVVVGASLYDYAKLLQLLSNHGTWGDQQLIDKDLLQNAFSRIVDVPVSDADNFFGGYLNIPYLGGGSNQTRATGFGPGEYVFNGWLNTHKRYGMPDDFFQANGNWGRTVAAFSPSLRMLVLVRIDGYYPVPEGSITVGKIAENLYILARAIQVDCSQYANAPLVTLPFMEFLLNK